MLKGFQATVRVVEDEIRTRKAVPFVSEEMTCESGSERSPNRRDSCVQ